MSYEIRNAEYADLEWMIETGKEMVEKEVQNPALYHYTTFLNLCMESVQKKASFIVEKDGEKVGLIGGVFVPHYLNSDILTLVEIMFYVYPDHRKGRAGLLLLKEYSSFAKENAKYATLSLLPTSELNDKTLEKVGFMLKERNYMMEN